ncbi:MAG: SDR family oxidoreductase [Planctomycetales bacterium]|nr:SDR family oxidoreductase [Planctomycetales bacterium]
MPTSLVTGGAGFIGSHLVQALVARGDNVRVLDNLSTGRKENLAGVWHQIEFAQGDITDEAAVQKAVAGVDFVFHQAAVASVPRSVDAPLESHAACTTGTLLLLDAARKAGVKRFVFAASSSAYGNQPTPVKKETDLPSPLSPYAAAKLAAEHFCHAFYHSYGLETVCLRYFNVFGPRQDPSGPYAAVIPIFVQLLLAGKSPMIYGDGQQTRDFTYVGNVVQANLLASTAPPAKIASSPSRVFNIGSGSAISLLDLLSDLNAICGTKIAANFQPPRTGDVRDSLADISLAQQILGYQSSVTLRKGLEKTVAAMR